MFALLVYDIDQSDGGKRLRRVAKECEQYGIRVQHSVFELDIHEADLTRLESQVLQIIDSEKDSVRVYRIGKITDRQIKILGHREQVEIGKDDAFFL